MPQYERYQYGRKQYGVFQTTPGENVPDGIGRHWKFIRSRFGVRRNGIVFWLYQHTPVSINGKTRRLRIGTNTGEWVREEQVAMKGKHPAIRLSSNINKVAIQSGRLELKGVQQ